MVSTTAPPRTEQPLAELAELAGGLNRDLWIAWADRSGLAPAAGEGDEVGLLVGNVRASMQEISGFTSPETTAWIQVGRQDFSVAVGERLRHALEHGEEQPRWRGSCLLRPQDQFIDVNEVPDAYRGEFLQVASMTVSHMGDNAEFPVAVMPRSTAVQCAVALTGRLSESLALPEGPGFVHLQRRLGAPHDEKWQVMPT